MVCLVVLLPSVLALSFSVTPSISPSVNVTTSDSFYCLFTPSDGSLTANITWYNDSVLWSGNDQDSSVTDGVQFQSINVESVSTSKLQSWKCQVTLNNATDSISMNSSPITLVNTAPTIIEIANQTAYEDTEFSLQLSAVDLDFDSFTWLSFDLNSSYYGGDSLFTISSSGLITFNQTDETLVGNHSMFIFADDDFSSGGSGSQLMNFELLPVNDAPVFVPISLNGTCLEASVCDHAVIATDEENSVLSFTANETFINMSSSGVLNFVPDVSHIGSQLVLINVSDGDLWVTAVLNLTINSTNHAPVFTYNSSNSSFAIQNQTTNFTFFVNATDVDPLDTVFFSIDSDCPLPNPWTIQRLTNGSGSTNASAQINVNLSNNNDFVACRDVQISIFDGRNFTVGNLSLNATVANFSLNITNSNDAPIIADESFYAENEVSSQFSNNNMSNVTLAKGLPFVFKVNATDGDSLTYEGEVLTYSLFGHNASLYQINSTSGLITSIASIMNESYVGNTFFDVRVSDDEGLDFNASINITVINNSLPIISAIDNSDCVEDIICYKEFTAFDGEGSNLTLSLAAVFIAPNNVSYSYDDSQLVSMFNATFISFNGSDTNYTINFTPQDFDVGNYSLNVTFIDGFGDFETQEVNFSITNVNDIPYLGDSYLSDILDALSFPVAAENFPFSKVLYGIDGDTYYGQDNLTFNYSFISGTMPISLVKLNMSAALLSFTPSSTDVGAYSLNLTVVDSTGNFSSKIVNFTVFDSSEAPIITDIKPYLNASNSTVYSFTSDVEASNISTVYVFENDSVTFDVQATDSDGLELKVDWYENGTLQVGNLDLTGVSSFQRNFSYNDSGVVNITVLVTDKGVATYTWLVNVSDLNQVPLFLHNLTELTATDGAAITGTQVFADFFRLSSPDNVVFLDPDDDGDDNGYIDANENNTLTFSFNTSTSCDAYANFSFVGERLTITPADVGNCTARFHATDLYGVVIDSNDIRIDILDLGQTTVTETVTSSSSSGSKTVTKIIPVPIDNDVPNVVKFIYPGISSLYSDGTVVIPFTMRNTWKKEISGIDLTFNSSIPELVGELSLDFIDSLAPNAFVDFNLTYLDYRFEAPFEVNLSAAISSLELIDTATVFINALEKGSYSEDAVKTRVGFARDLLNDNSECQELNEILTSAESETDSDISLKLVNSVINGCKYLINTKKSPTTEVPQSFIGKVGIYTENYVDYKLLFTIILGMTILSMGVGIFSRFKLKKI